MKLHFLGASIYPLSHFEVLGLYFFQSFPEISFMEG